MKTLIDLVVWESRTLAEALDNGKIGIAGAVRILRGMARDLEEAQAESQKPFEGELPSLSNFLSEAKPS